ncbi:MAG: glycoside hydrolase family 30 beta sandwich domain-containing protein [Ferruginibacter sp.]
MILLLMLIWPIFLFTDCTKSTPGSTPAPITPVTPVPTTPPVTTTNDVSFWLTKGDQSVLLQKQTDVLSFGTAANTNATIEVDSTVEMQTIDGFGYTLTGGSATLINGLGSTEKASLLHELFGKGSNDISISYLRISIGASDLSASDFTYDDMPAGQTDASLANFSLASEKTDLIPLLKDIVAINPSIKILGSPWTAPTWMKDNNNFTGGSLLTQYYAAYARYFVKYIQQMKAEGITIDAITPQNEPLHGGNNPSMVMTAAQQAVFIKNALGPAFQSANIATKIIVYDHNCDRADYPLDVLNDAAARAFVNGSAFHLYGGDIGALTTVHNAYPDKQVYFTEQYTPSNGNFGGDLKWHLKNVVIGSMRNWSRNALEWNLANDIFYGPHTNGGCTTCKGALTIGSSITRNVSYYIIAHASKFVPAGSVHIASNNSGNIYTVAFKTPDGKKVLIVENDDNTGIAFNIKFNNKWVTTSLPAGSVGTYLW